MSIKVYAAYRLKKSTDLWPWLRDTRRQGEEEVRGVLRKMYGEFADEVDPHSDEYKKCATVSGRSEAAIRLNIAHKAIRDGYKGQLTDPYRGPFNFDVSLTVREHKKRLYIIPHCDYPMSKTLDFLKADPRLEDFAYWDNTDHPEHISYSDWKKRRKVWESLTEGNDWEDYLAIVVMEWSKFYLVDPYHGMVKEADGLRREPH